MEPNQISVYVPGHGQFTTTPAQLDQAIENFLPATLKQLNQYIRYEIVCDDYPPIETITEALMVIADCQHAGYKPNWARNTPLWDADEEQRRKDAEYAERLDHLQTVRALACDLWNKAHGGERYRHFPTEADRREAYGDEIVDKALAWGTKYTVDQMSAADYCYDALDAMDRGVEIDAILALLEPVNR